MYFLKMYFLTSKNTIVKIKSREIDFLHTLKVYSLSANYLCIVHTCILEVFLQHLINKLDIELQTLITFRYSILNKLKLSSRCNTLLEFLDT